MGLYIMLGGNVTRRVQPQLTLFVSLWFRMGLSGRLKQSLKLLKITTSLVLLMQHPVMITSFMSMMLIDGTAQ